MTTSRKPVKVCMAVVDANELNGLEHQDEPGQSPVLHTAIHNLLEGLRERDDLEIEVIYGRRNAQPGEDRQDGCLHYIPVPYRPLPIPGMGGPYLGRLFALLAHIRRTRPDVVHGQGTERESGMVAALCSRPSLVTLHGNFRAIARVLKPKPFSYYWINPWIESFVIPRVSGVICISNHTKRSVEKLNRHTRVVPNPVGYSWFEVIPKACQSPEIVCIGSISEIKNQVILMEAGDAVIQQFPSATFHFYGQCNEATAYGSAFLAAIAKRPWCRHHNFCTIPELQEVLSTATALVLPSIEDNCPMVVLEAMAAGVPVVASRVGGIPDLIDHGRTGLLFDRGQPTVLVENLLKVLSSPPLAADLASAARSDALARFSPRAVAESHAQAYTELGNR